MFIVTQSNGNGQVDILAIAKYRLPKDMIDGLVALEEIAYELAHQEQQAVLTAKQNPEEEKMRSGGCVKLTDGCRRLDGQDCEPDCPLRKQAISPQTAAQFKEPEQIKPFGGRCPEDGSFLDEDGTCSHGHHAD